MLSIPIEKKMLSIPIENRMLSIPIENIMLSIPIENKMLSKEKYDVVYSYREIRCNGYRNTMQRRENFGGVFGLFLDFFWTFLDFRFWTF